MAKQVNIHEAKSQLSRLLADVEAGEEVVIAKAGRPVAKLVRAGESLPPRQPGAWKGKVWIGPDFDAPLPELDEAFYHGATDAE